MSTEYLRLKEHEILISQELIGWGAFADVHIGYWPNSDHEKLAVKSFRKIKTENSAAILDKYYRRLNREILTWLRAQPHPNILPFLGIYEYQDRGKLPALVSPLREAGDVLDYLAKYAHKCRPLALGIANGLAHLHSFDIIHGDLKPRNILIRIERDGSPVPEIADFGRARILNVRGYTGSLYPTARYAAPEVLNPPHSDEIDPIISIPSEQANKLLTKESDVWSLGMVLLHVLSGRMPYPRFNDPQVMLALADNQEPEEGDHAKLANCPARERVWPLLRRCWKLVEGPQARITAKKFAEELNR